MNANVSTITAAADLAAHRVVTRDGNYAGTATLIAHGVTMADCKSGDQVAVYLIDSGAIIPVSCSENIAVTDIATFDSNGQIQVRTSSEKAVGQIIKAASAGEDALVQFFGPQAPALTS